MCSKKRSREKLIWTFVFVCSVLLLFAALIAGAHYVLYRIGRSDMLDYENVKVSFSLAVDDSISTSDDGKTVSYHGRDYRLNEKITTVLLIGVDKTELAGGETYGNGGEADCILLLAIDTETGETTLINLSRETYAQVDIYSASGKLLETRGTQLCRAYAYGDGAELSCENMLKSVEQLLYGLPIHSYIALDTRFIGAATDAVGGITLTAMSDILMPDKSILKAGEEVTLRGRDAERYVRYRNKKLLISNQLRMERQKQFMELFVKKALQQSRGDVTTVLELYDAMSGYMTTDLSIADVTFLLTCFLENGASFQFKGIEGTLGRIDINAVFYPDETSVYETLLDVYYTPVE